MIDGKGNAIPFKLRLEILKNPGFPAPLSTFKRSQKSAFDFNQGRSYRNNRSFDKKKKISDNSGGMTLTQQELDAAFREAKVRTERLPGEDHQTHDDIVHYQRVRAIQHKYGTTSRRAEEILRERPRRAGG